jgi:hypothetical protein
MADVMPTDLFSTLRRSMDDHPGAIGSSSTVAVADFYGNRETWFVETFRVDGHELVFLERSAASGGSRMVLPKEVAAALARHRDQITTRARSKAAQRAVDTKREKGIAVGNRAALELARTAPRKPRRRRGGK